MNKPPRQDRSLIAWAVILALVALLVWNNAKPAIGESDGTRLAIPLMQSRYLVGAVELGAPGLDGTKAFEQAETLFPADDDSLQLRRAVLAGELVGPEAALGVLELLQQRYRQEEIEISEPTNPETAALLQRLYRGYEKSPGDMSALTPEEQTTVRERLGWFGELALAPADGDAQNRAQVLRPARRTLVGILCFVILGGIAVLLGLGILTGVVVLALVQRAQPLPAWLVHRSPAATGHGRLYAETFAVYLVLFLLLSLVLSNKGQLWLSGVAMVGSLVALVWPVWRGLSFSQLGEELGLRATRSLLLECFYGVMTYLAALPLVVLGVVVTFLLIGIARLFGVEVGPGRGNMPTHPVVGLALQGNLWVWVQLFVVAALLAPLVEEVFFRGALYTHLRTATGSVVASTLISSFLFAVIHPQGWLGVPMLMALAICFSLAREWRGSLIAPMLAHGLNNGVMLLLLLLLAG